MNQMKRQRVEYYKESYPPGTRILLIHMGSDPRPVMDDTRGTVRCVDDMGTIHCDFDNGRCLGIIPEEDSFRRLTETELLQEQEGGMQLQ